MAVLDALLACFLQIPDTALPPLHNSPSFGPILTFKIMLAAASPSVAEEIAAEAMGAARGRRLGEEDDEDEDYIDMDMSSGNGFPFCSIPPPPHPGEFEFQMGPRPAAASPADELFYKGKLLPLHNPPRLRMVEKLLEHPDALATGAAGPPARCSTSGPGVEDPGRYCSAALVRSRRRSSWSTKLDAKLKASRAYLKSLFARRRRSEPCSGEKAVGSLGLDEEVFRRKSVSGAINWSLAAAAGSSSSASSLSSSSSSSSSSFSGASSNRFGQLPVLLNRSSSFSSEAESSIQGAIAHCKRSQQQARILGRKSASDVGLCSLSSSMIASACDHHHHQPQQLSYRWL